MNNEKLKTLNDLPMNHDDEDIRAEAVKWVKHLREIKEPYGINILTDLNKKQKEECNYIASLVIKYFFNLTEEDLK